MITFLSGLLVQKKSTEAILEINGVGYKVFISANTAGQLPNLGEKTRLLTTFIVREDAQILFGFLQESERKSFELLISVSGIGPKTAIAMLSAVSPEELQQMILQDNIGMLRQIPGIGAKTAARLVVELRDKFMTADFKATSTTSIDVSGERQDALAALEALGFNRATAEKKLREVFKLHPQVSRSDELVRLALRQ